MYYSIEDLPDMQKCAGKLRHEAAQSGTTALSGQQSEATHVLQAINAIKIPALTGGDLQLFQALVRDMWPGIAPEAEQSAALQHALQEALQDWGLEAAGGQVCSCSTCRSCKWWQGMRCETAC